MTNAYKSEMVEVELDVLIQKAVEHAESTVGPHISKEIALTKFLEDFGINSTKIRDIALMRFEDYHNKIWERVLPTK